MSNKNFGFSTEAEEVATYFADEIKGKTVLITGCTWNGLGAEVARTIAKHHAALVIIAGRKQEQLDETTQKIKEETPSANIRSLVVDLASLNSVRHAAAEVNACPENIDVLINNAGILGCPYRTTEDGFEAQFGTNHLGPFLFTNLILQKILASKSPRIVNVSSVAHLLSAIRFDDLFFDNGNTYTKWLAYGQSKTANILFARELSKRYGSKGLVTVSLHPGEIKTNLARDVKPGDVTGPVKDHEGNVLDFSGMVYKTIAQGTSTHLVAAFDPTIASESGSYLMNCQIAMDQAKPWATDDTQAEKLWTLSEKLVGQNFA
jgi:NAD(P)-dependent dehydrogenase (short-subunit alcohol dehydrogenase family)